MTKAQPISLAHTKQRLILTSRAIACSIRKLGRALEAFMIFLQIDRLNSIEDARSLLQKSIGVEFGTLPPYLYALYSIRPGTNPQAVRRIKSVALQEMIHMCMVSNILNSLGADPVLLPQAYPGPLPGDIGPNGKPLPLHLYPFSREAMEQSMEIEQPENPPHFPEKPLAMLETNKAVTIGKFYEALDCFLATLPASDWAVGRNQIVDNQFFTGLLFAVNNYEDAHNAIQEIVSEGEGTIKGAKVNPLDFQEEVAHYFRFGEIYHDRVLTKADNPEGYVWGPDRLGVDWSGVYPAISDPGLHDFSIESPEAQAAQDACNGSYSAMVNALQGALIGKDGELGRAVQEMFRLRAAALHAFAVPLAGGLSAGPAFLYKSSVGETA